MNVLQFPFIPRALATALGAVITHAGASAFLQPITFTANFGIPQQDPINPWVYAFAARELTLGLTLCTFAARREWKAVGLVGVLMAICGGTDGVLDGIYGDGWESAWKTHLGPTILFAPVSWYLLLR
jgi:hypothetical protein